VFVLTHHVRDPLAMAGATLVTHITYRVGDRTLRRA
jgi:hypothetical protein